MSSNSIDLDIDLLQPNPLQPRGLITPESLIELVDSVREHGVLEPLVVAQTPAGYQIIAGERRWRAAKLAGLGKVPVMIKQTTIRGMLEMALVENVQRTDLNPLERAQAFQRLMAEFSLTNSEIAQRVGKSPAYISNTLRLLTLPDALKDALISGATTEGHVRAIIALEDPKLMVEAYKQILKDGLSVRGAEDLTRRMKVQFQKGTKPARDIVTGEEIDKMQDEMTKSLSKFIKSIVKLRRSRIETKIAIILKGNLEETEPTLKRIHQFVASLESLGNFVTYMRY